MDALLFSRLSGLLLGPLGIHMRPLNEIRGTEPLFREQIELFFFGRQCRIKLIVIGRERSGFGRSVTLHLRSVMKCYEVFVTYLCA